MENDERQVIPIVVDDRETRGPVPDALRETGRFEIQVQRLGLGDYLIDKTLLFERKTIHDLAESIKQGRLFDQALRLTQGKLPAALILEGTSADLAKTGMRWEAIQGALLTVTLFMGLPILRTRSAKESAQTLAFAAGQQVNIANESLQRRGRRPKGKARLQRYILQGLPGVGPFRARALLERFGSVSGVIGADCKALASVKGVGKRTAGRIRWALEE